MALKLGGTAKSIRPSLIGWVDFFSAKRKDVQTVEYNLH